MYLRLFSIFQGKDKVEIGFVVHFTAVCQALFENSVHKGWGQGSRPVGQQLFSAEHPVVVLVEIQVGAVHSEGRRRGKPVGFLGVFGQVLIAELQEIVQEAAGQDILEEKHFNESRP